MAAARTARETASVPKERRRKKEAIGRSFTLVRGGIDSAASSTIYGTTLKAKVLRSGQTQKFDSIIATSYSTIGGPGATIHRRTGMDESA
jgi:hypothetical protein